MTVNAHSFNDATSGTKLQVLTNFRNAAVNASQGTSTSGLSLQSMGHQFNPHLLNRFADVEYDICKLVQLRSASEVSGLSSCNILVSSVQCMQNPPVASKVFKKQFKSH